MSLILPAEADAPDVDLTECAARESASEVTPSRYFRWYGVVNRILAAALLVPALPVIGLLVLLVRATSKGPGFFRQTRVGRNGRTFQMLKIRTMHHNAEAQTGAVWSVPNDPRTTSLGEWLRKMHLDEFPQLWNVLRGQMALVGPRPERPEFTQKLAVEIPGYMDRHQILPGITGLAQINLPPDATLECVRKKLVLDFDYLQNGSLFLDLRILACTALRLFGVSGITSARLLRVLRIVPTPTSKQGDPDEVGAAEGAGFEVDRLRSA
jgi:lipopolysaccharide/colanic/teichoic acid biosynthesis glycosyltransferase